MSNKSIQLTETEIKAILRGADDIIMQAGRSLLAKILKGSRAKKVLELKLDECPAYGSLRDFTIPEITEKINWMIAHDFLEITYSGKLPMITFTERGWKIQADQRANELLLEWQNYLADAVTDPDMHYLKDRNREMIFLFLDKIQETKDQNYIPYLEAWEKIEYKKVRARIREVIEAIQLQKPVDKREIDALDMTLTEALQVEEQQDILIKCWECGDRFDFTVGEQEFYKLKGFVYPKRCLECREKSNGPYF